MKWFGARILSLACWATRMTRNYAVRFDSVAWCRDDCGETEHIDY
jgi:hypothetical protein